MKENDITKYELPEKLKNLMEASLLLENSVRKFKDSEYKRILGYDTATEAEAMTDHLEMAERAVASSYRLLCQYAHDYILTNVIRANDGMTIWNRFGIIEGSTKSNEI